MTGLTLSPSQLEWARRAADEERLSDKLDLRLQDYRDVKGTFDRIVSIEMIEAVGERYWPDYFGAIAQRLSKGGSAVLQAITIADDRFEAYRKAADFIQRYVFPGGMLPSPSVLERYAAEAGLKSYIAKRSRTAMRSRSLNGADGCCMHGRRFRRRVSTRGLGGCGNTTFAIARRAFAQARSMWASTSSYTPAHNEKRPAI